MTLKLFQQKKILRIKHKISTVICRNIDFGKTFFTPEKVLRITQDYSFPIVADPSRRRLPKISVQ